jgi:hypothetical protein
LSNAVIALRARSISTVGTAPGAESFDVGIASPLLLATCKRRPSADNLFDKRSVNHRNHNHLSDWSSPGGMAHPMKSVDFSLH